MKKSVIYNTIVPNNGKRQKKERISFAGRHREEEGKRDSCLSIPEEKKAPYSLRCIKRKEGFHPTTHAPFAQAKETSISTRRAR